MIETLDLLTLPDRPELADLRKAVDKWKRCREQTDAAKALAEYRAKIEAEAMDRALLLLARSWE